MYKSGQGHVLGVGGGYTPYPYPYPCPCPRERRSVEAVCCMPFYTISRYFENLRQELAAASCHLIPCHAVLKRLPTTIPTTLLPFSETLRPHPTRRQKQNRHRAHKHTATGQIQHVIRAPSQQMRRNKRTDDTKDPAPKAGHTRRGAAYRRGESFGRPAVEDGVEHGLEEILHGVEADVRGLGVDGREEEERGGHEGAGDDHGPFAADEGDAVHQGAEEDAGDAADVDDDVVAVGFLHANRDGCILAQEDGWEV